MSSKVLIGLVMSMAGLCVTVMLENIGELDLEPSIAVMVTGILSAVAAYLKSESRPAPSARQVIHDELVAIRDLEFKTR